MYETNEKMNLKELFQELKKHRKEWFFFSGIIVNDFNQEVKTDLKVYEKSIQILRTGSTGINYANEYGLNTIKEMESHISNQVNYPLVIR